MFLEENGGNSYYPKTNYKDPSNDKRKTSSRFGLGIVVGVLITLSVIMLIFTATVKSLVKKGYIHLGTNGEIYVQSDPVTDSEGVGDDVQQKLNTLDSLMDLFYFDDVDNEKAKSNIYKAYINSYGDKYSVYYTPEEYKSMLESTSGTFYGVGAVCQKKEDGTVLIIEAYEDAPAYKAGIRAGDCVSKVDGLDVKTMDLSVVVSKIKGEKGTEVELEILRDSEVKNFKVTRDKVDIKTIEYKMLDNNIGYIKITQFDEITTGQFKAALDDLTNQDMQGLILDVRDNPGGMLSTVVDILDYILPNGLIVYTKDKDGNKKEYSGSDNHEINVPAAVLVNGDSASASEIFAGAIQDYEKATIIGVQTFGKGIVQTIRPLTDGSAVKFTISKYFTPKGQELHGKGVTPDKKVEMDKNSETDVQLDAAIEHIKGQLK